MNIVRVNTSTPYDVVIGNKILSDAGKYLCELGFTEKVAIISDENVWSFYGETLTESLNAANIAVCSFVFTPGEQSKNAGTYLSILNFLAENHITRSDAVIALGGGVVGDIAGFAAATYLRGIPYVQVPTSLLAMVDSSVGGKTAIDLPAGKNLVGAFCQPRLVLCDIDTLNSLPEEIFRDGCAEVLKYGVLFDKAMFSVLIEDGLDFDRKAIVARCVELKRDVVENDEFDRGERMKLNLGHTIGHGIEAGTDYRISHGKAVAAGMAIIARASLRYHICDENTVEQIVAGIKRFGLPVSTDLDVAQLFKSALSDKKRSGGDVSLIVPKEIGNCIIQKTDIQELESFIKAGI